MVDYSCLENTPPKTNMESKNDGFSIGISSSRGSFSGSMLVFGDVILSCMLTVIA